jgi:hypothetical protein
MPVPWVGPREEIWVNTDCDRERFYMNACGFSEDDKNSWPLWRTGVEGRETQVRWLTGTAPPPPNMRIDDHAREGVVIYWDNFSERVPDPKTQEIDFEGYHLWRADTWTRPLGTSVETGPPTELWRALLQVDRRTGWTEFHYDPLGRLSAEERSRLIDDMKLFLARHRHEDPPCPPEVTPEECDTLAGLARWEFQFPGGRQYYRYVDRLIQLGRPYFYSVVAFDDGGGYFERRQAGDPASNFRYIEPKSASQVADVYDENLIYVVPNPATKQSMAAWALNPTNDDPTGIKVEFRNLPPSRGTIRIYTLSADLVKELHFDATGGVGTAKWDLVSRSGQDVTSGVYLYSIEFQDSRFRRVVKKFTVIR